MYTYETRVRMRDTDAAGVTYFASQLSLAHEALEAFLESVGMGLGTILRSARYVAPVAHVEAEYRQPLFAGDRLIIELRCGRIGETSFTMEYRMRNGDGDAVGSARITQTIVDRSSRKKLPIPLPLRSALESIGRSAG